MAVLLSLPPRSHAHTAVWEWAAVNVNGKRQTLNPESIVTKFQTRD